MAHQAFRANVGIVVINASRQVLAFERRRQAGAWQLPQGGLDEGEEPLVAALRELEEETGLTAEDVSLVGEHPQWLAYDLPEKYRRKRWRGQVQRWFLFRLKEGSRPNLELAKDDEFSAFRWMPMAELVEAIWSVKQAIYAELQRHFEL